MFSSVAAVKDFFIPRFTKSSLALLSIALVFTAVLDSDFWSMVKYMVIFFSEVHIIGVLFFGVLMPVFAAFGWLQGILFMFNRHSFITSLDGQKWLVSMFAFTTFAIMGLEYIFGVIMQGEPSLWLKLFTFYSLFYFGLQILLIKNDMTAFIGKINLSQPVTVLQRVGIIGVLIAVYGVCYFALSAPPISWVVPVSIAIVLWNVLERRLL